ncbi:MAG: replicative DNA helicase [Clostridia bacterium]|nr:replicative DNA helicase [Clostridia bacterium]
MALSEELGRKLPFSLEAEQSVLGSILVDPECFNKLPSIVSESDFYLEEHKGIYSAMQKLFLESKMIDPVTLMSELVKNGTYKTEEDGTRYIKLIADVVPTAENVSEYAKIVRNNSLLRSLIEECAEISDIAFSGSEDASRVIGDAEQRIFSLAQGNESKEFRHIKDVLVSEMNLLKKLQTEGTAAMNIPTGFSGLDKVLVGLGNTDLVLVGARPGMGKTSFALNIATSVARSFKERGEDKKVCIFSLEMSNEQLISRILSSEAMIESGHLRSGNISGEEWKKLAEAASLLSECQIYTDDTTGLTITAMKSKLRRARNVGMIVIDYLQLMQSDRRIDNRVNEVAEISRNLKIMAKEFGVPVICCAQLSRGPESRTDKRPMLSDLRDSGAIEQDADVVLFLYRDEYYDDKEAGQNTAEIIIAKNRHGSTGKVNMGFIGKYTKFTTLSDRDDDL